jgi:hypothetical protein
MECRHLNGNPGDNRLENLSWGTHKENMIDRNGHGKFHPLIGEKHPNSKLTETDVRVIRRLPWKQRLIARCFGINQAQVSAIKLRRQWKHVPDLILA